jgi:hypothetical protein
VAATSTPYLVSVYLVAIDPDPQAGDVLGPFDSSDFSAIERGKDALFEGGPAGREVYRIADAAHAAEAREKATAAWAHGPGEPRERR